MNIKKIVTLFLAISTNINADLPMELPPKIKVPYSFDAGPLENVTGQKKITVKGEINLKTKDFSLSSSPFKNIQLGALLITEVNVSLSKKNKLQVYGDAKLLDTEARLSLKDIKKKSITLNLTFKKDKKPKVVLPNGTVVDLSEAEVKVVGKEVTISSTVRVGAKPIVFTFKKVDGKAIFSARVENVKISDIISSLRGSKYENIMLNELEYTYEKKKKETITHIKGKANFSQIEMNDLDEDTTQLNINLDISSQGGFHLVAELTSLELPIVGEVKNERLTIRKKTPEEIRKEKEEAAKQFEDYKPEKFYIILEGKANINLPGQDEAVDIKLSSKLTDDGNFRIEGVIEDDIDIKGVTFNKPKIKISREDLYLYLKGTGYIPSVDLQVTGEIEIQYFIDPREARKGIKKGSEYVVNFKGDVVKKETIFPFAGSKIPGIENIGFIGATVQFRVGSDTPDFIKADDITNYISISGRGTFYGDEFQGTLKFLETYSEKKGLVIIFDVPTEWKLSKLIPELKGTHLEQLPFKDFQILISTIQFREPSLGRITVNTGIAMYAKLRDFPELDDIYEKSLEDLAFYGSLNPLDGSFGIAAQIPAKINFGKDSPITSGPSRLEIEFKKGSDDDSEGSALTQAVESADPSSKRTLRFFLKTKLFVQVGPDNLEFTGRISINLAKRTFRFEFTMEEMWHHPLKIKGLENLAIGDVGLRADIALSAAAAATGGIPLETLGIAGTIEMGENKYTLAIQPSKDPTKAFLYFEADKLGISDLINAVSSLGTNLSHDKAQLMPPFEIQDAKIAIVTDPGGEIGQIKFPPGYTIAGKMILENWGADVQVSLEPSGFTIYGKAKEINYKDLFKITGKGEDEILGTSDDGPNIDVRLSILEQYFKISGIVQLLGIKAETDIAVDHRGVKFKLEGKIYELWNTSINIETKDNDLKFQAKLHDDFKEYFESEEYKNSMAKYLTSIEFLRLRLGRERASQLKSAAHASHMVDFYSAKLLHARISALQQYKDRIIREAKNRDLANLTIALLDAKILGLAAYKATIGELGKTAQTITHNFSIKEASFTGSIGQQSSTLHVKGHAFGHNFESTVQYDNANHWESLKGVWEEVFETRYIPDALSNIKSNAIKITNTLGDETSKITQFIADGTIKFGEDVSGGIQQLGEDITKGAITFQKGTIKFGKNVGKTSTVIYEDTKAEVTQFGKDAGKTAAKTAEALRKEAEKTAATLKRETEKTAEALRRKAEKLRRDANKTWKKLGGWLWK